MTKHVNYRFGKFAVAISILILAAASPAFATCSSPKNVIEAENCKPGNPATEWDVSGVGDPSIQGFTTDISVNLGQTVFFKVSTDATAYRLDIYRMGYYGGMGARKVATISPSVPLPQNQPACLSDTATSLVDCGNWGVSAFWAVPANAASGLYFARLVRLDTSGANHVFFIVRDDAGHSDLVFKTSDLAWQAYNDYGSPGASLYGCDGTFNTCRPYKVSYNRPFQTRSYSPITWVFSAEYPMVRWLEANGYDVSYISGVDTDRHGTLLTNHKVFLSVGHDEYWSGNERANVEAARAAGVHLAFFSGNEVFWKTRWENSIDGSATPYRTLVCYKEPANSIFDPEDPPTWTGTWRDPRFSPPADGGRPENALSGTIFQIEGRTGCTDSIIVPQDDGKMRFWRNTSMASLLPGQVYTLPAGTLGAEWDIDADNGFRPAGLFRLSTATVTVTSGYLLDYGGTTYGPGTATHHLTLYRYQGKSLVFGAGTIQWSWGLDGNHDNGCSPPDSNMQQATVNLLADMGVQPATLQAGLIPALQSSDTIAPISAITFPAPGSAVRDYSMVTITGTAGDSGGGVVGGVELSFDGGTTWHPATGRENWSFVWAAPGIPQSVTIKSRAVDDSGNIETPSSGISVNVISPLSIAVTPSNPTTTVGATKQFTATGTYQGGSTQNLTNQVTWSSSNTPVATINGTGLATAQRAGSATIAASLNGITGSTSLNVQPVSQTCPCTIWSSGTVPTIVDVGPGPAVELGVKFRADANGYITGLRFYKSTNNTGMHVANLWSLTGTLLATATFSGETPSGWQQVNFSAPVSITANTVYVASYYTSVGDYSFDGDYFATAGFDDPPLHALAEGVSGSNGVYAYGSTSSFPTSTYNSSNYWVDVVFIAQLVSQLASITVTPSNPTVTVGQTSQFTATGRFADGSTQNLTSQVPWSSSNTAVATINGTGLATAQSPGSTTITASLNGITGSTSLNVQPLPCPCTIWSSGTVPALVDVGPGPAVELGVKFRADANGYITGLRFYKSTNNTGMHVANLWSLTGTLLATATFSGETSSGWQQVNFSAPVSITANTVYVASYYTSVGDYSFDRDYFATAGFDDPPLHALAEGVSGSNGVYAYGSTSSFPTSTYNSSNYWVDVVFVAQLAPPLVSITVTPSNSIVAVGQTPQFTATGTYQDGSTQNLTSQVTWSSSNAAVAAISNSAGSQGLTSTLGQGATTITALSGSVSGSTTLTVTPPVLVSIAVTPATPSILLGTKQQFTATGTFSDSSTQNLTTSVTWSSSNTAAATISNAAGSQGLASSTAQGATTITALSGSVSGSTTLTVTAPVLVSIAVTPANPSIPLGTKQQFTATGTFTDSSTQNVTTLVTWSSSNAAAATISNAAGSQGLASSAAQGATTITALSGSVSGAATLTVTPPVLVSIAVKPGDPTIPLGTKQQFTATGTFSDGSTQNLTTSVTWSSSNTAAATISNTPGSQGLASSMAQGTTTITATSGSIARSTTLKVDPPVLASIAVTPVNPSTPVGKTIQFTATGTFTDGSTQDLTSSARWSSSNTQVAKVNLSGLAVARSTGSATIAASLHGITGSTSLNVTPP